MKTPEDFLRDAFTESEIAKDKSLYPEAQQRFYIYKAMRAYAEYCVRERNTMKVFNELQE